MMQAQHMNKYLESAVQTATPAQLLIMLYDGAIRFCRQAIDAIQKKNPQDAHTNLMKVQDIVMEFVITLDRSQPIAENLLSLYDYFIFRLKEANSKKSIEPIQDVMANLSELREAWVQAAKIVNASAAGAHHG